VHITFYKAGRVPVPPKLYGGTERVVYWLGKALVELGHRVTLIANAQSRISGVELRPLPENKYDLPAWLKLIPDSTDILHLWDKTEATLKKPFVITAEGNGQPGEQFPLNTIFVSLKHAANHGSRHFVHNGIDPSDYLFSEKRENFAVFLAKARWKVKNFHGAMAVAHRAGIELRVLGSRNWPFNLQRLFPKIRGVRYYGMLGGSEKAEIISRARCSIFPVRWHEPFGISTIEAMVSGAYVVGTPYGSLPEIVTPEVGVLSANANELAEAVRNPQQFNPQTCRNRVLCGGFTHLDMARKYLKYYEQVLTRGSLDDENSPVPATKPGFVANQLLPWED
jgi:glycosyltransferase involved in cell wall biosynthesis